MRHLPPLLDSARWPLIAFGLVAAGLALLVAALLVALS
jgi:hypothetical protein